MTAAAVALITAVGPPDCGVEQGTFAGHLAPPCAGKPLCGATILAREAKGEGAMATDGWAGVVRGKPAVGQVAERSRTTSMADVEAFTAMTGDRNPLHYDRALAERSPFGRLIVQGGRDLGDPERAGGGGPAGAGLGLPRRRVEFVKAVGVDETITGRVEILEVRDDKPICRIATSVRNAAGEDCLTGTATVYTMPLLQG